MQCNLRGKIANVTPLTLDKTLTLEGASADAKAVGEAIQRSEKRATDALNTHNEDAKNPHNVTAEQVGLGNVNNTSDMDKPVSTAQAEAIKAVSDKADTKAETHTFPGTFLSGDWGEEAPYTQTITVEGLLADDKPMVDIDLSEAGDPLAVIEAWGLVHRCTVAADNTVTAYCYQDAPATDIPVVFKVVR